MQQIDLVKPEDLKDNMEYIINFARKKGFLSPMMFPVSSKYESEGKETSGFKELRVYINEAVTSAGTLGDKIGGRISVADEITKNIAKVMNNKKSSLDDLKMRDFK